MCSLKPRCLCNAAWARVAVPCAASLLLAAVLVPGAAGRQGTPAADTFVVAIAEGACATGDPESADDLGVTTTGDGVGDGLLVARRQAAVGLDHLLAEGAHSVTIREGSGTEAALIACADLSGEPVEGTLAVAVLPVDADGPSGVAVLKEESDMAIRVSVYLLAGAAATPVAVR